MQKTNSDEIVSGKNENEHFDNNEIGRTSTNIQDIAHETVHVSEEDNRRIVRKTDLVILTCLMCTYFYQYVIAN